MKDFIQVGTTDRTVLVYIPDGGQTDGSGKTLLAAGDIQVSYTRVETDNDVITTDVTSSMNDLANLTAAHNDWGWYECDATNAPGLYRLDVADAVFATGAWYAVVYVMVAASDASATPMEFVLSGSVVNQVYSDTTIITSAQVVVKSQVLVVKSWVSDANSALVIVNAYCSDIQSDTSDIQSKLVKVYSDTTLATDDVARNNTASGGGATSITLDASASAVASFYVGDIVVVNSGTGAGQARVITAYDSTTKVCTVAPAWATNPTNGSGFMVLAVPSAPEGDISDVVSLLTKVYSDSTAIEGGSGALTVGQISQLDELQANMTIVVSDTLDIQTVVSDINSDTNVLLTKIGENDFSDILSAATIIKSQVLVIKSDTSDLKSSMTLVRVKTDDMTYTISGKLDANVEAVNGTIVTGSGTTGDPWGP